MDSLEIKKELTKTYSQLVEYLLEKYGCSKFDYFINESCKSKNSKISRTDEGLYCHHIDEDKAIMLCKDKFAINNLFEYQKADRLVYCNIIEHLILHIKIFEEPKNVDANSMEVQGIGGIIALICPQINDYFNGYVFKQSYLKKVFSLVENNFEDYIGILKYFLCILDKKPIYKLLVTRKKLAYGWNQEVVEKVYDRIK